MSSSNPQDLTILRTKAEVRAWRNARRSAGDTVGFVPTMGYLHEGHLSLIREARLRSDVVLVSIFVNPTQFGPNEDLDAYPRDTEGDLLKIEESGGHAVFLPSVAEMYSSSAQTRVVTGSLGSGLCGASRPTHFDGVCTVVAKLFNITGCDLAVFGQKDFQQLAIIKQMVHDLDLPVQIIAAPIVREADGLAMSSRNVYLSPAHRTEARVLSRSLEQVRILWNAGERDPRALRQRVEACLQQSPSADVDYIDVVSAMSLAPFEEQCTEDVLVALAVRFGRTRLIDNTVLSVP